MWQSNFMDDYHITILVDNDSWILPWAIQLVEKLLAKGMRVSLARDHASVQSGWINFLLGCTRIAPKEVLQRNRHNLVVHESALPQGRGFAPMAWQILAGANRITVCLIEAGDEADTGDIWLKEVIELNGTELCEEWRSLQGAATLRLCLGAIEHFPIIRPEKQQGTPTHYPRRRPQDSELCVDSSIREQFGLLRVVDNQRYPAFFELNGQRYTLQINKVK
jgi:methionyl-tRNA formyltransferase